MKAHAAVDLPPGRYMDANSGRVFRLADHTSTAGVVTRRIYEQFALKDERFIDATGYLTLTHKPRAGNPSYWPLYWEEIGE